MSGHAVVIAGAGSVGLMLAGELALAGVDAAVVEPRMNQDLVGQRALGISARTIEVFDQRGIAERFLEQGQTGQFNGFGWMRLDISDFPTRHNYGLSLTQQLIEPTLADWVGELGVTIYRGREVAGFAQSASGVDVRLSDGESLRAQYLVGCDGGRSMVRKTAGIAFPGWDASSSSLIGEVEMDQEPETGLRRDEKGLHSISRTEPAGPVRVMVAEEQLGRTEEPTLDDLSKALIRVYGSDFGLSSAKWISRFTDTSRQAESYRDRRVLLAGDSAHVHSPMGGQGLSTGVQDAVNLGWKLAQVVRGTSPESLLDTYHAERHPVAARVVHNTMAQVALTRADARTEALRDIVSDLLGVDEARKRIAGMMCGLDVHYDLGEGHPLLGRRMPDLDLVTPGGPLRVYSLLHTARPVLLNLAEPGAFGTGALGTGALDLDGWTDRVQLVEAEYAGAWEVPVLGTVSAPDAVLIRPDGHVAWVGERAGERSGDGLADGLTDALTTWFGPPTAD